MMYLLRGFDIYDLTSRFDVSLQVAKYAYRHAKNRINIHGFLLEDYELEFLKAYYKKHYSIDFKSFKTMKQITYDTKR